MSSSVCLMLATLSSRDWFRSRSSNTKLNPDLWAWGICQFVWSRWSRSTQCLTNTFSNCISSSSSFCMAGISEPGLSIAGVEISLLSFRGPVEQNWFRFVGFVAWISEWPKPLDPQMCAFLPRSCEQIITAPAFLSTRPIVSIATDRNDFVYRRFCPWFLFRTVSSLEKRN